VAGDRRMSRSVKTGRKNLKWLISWRRGYKRAIKQKEGISDVSYIHFVKPYRIAVNCDSQKTRT
jgi:hypothetical protein